VAVTLALGSVLVACGGGQSGSDSADGSGGWTGTTAPVAGEWLGSCGGLPGGSQSSKTTVTLSQTGLSELRAQFSQSVYTGLSCGGSPTVRDLGSATLTLQETDGQVLTVQALGATPQKVKSVDSSGTYWAWIALKDAQTLGYLEGAQSATEAYPPLADATGSNLIVYTRVVTP
jgi:hypothetical protein